MSEYTKGPWHLIDDCIRAPKAVGISDQMADYRGAIICDMSAGLGHSMGERYLARKHALPETRANANLIAAAPELYGALKEGLRIASDDDDEIFGGDLQARETAIVKWRIATRIALAKAEGKS